MLKLPNVTLFILDCINLDRALFAVRESMENINFGEVIVATSLDYSMCEMNDIKFVKIKHISDLYQYSNFMIQELNDYVNTSHVLVIQWDGFVLNHKAWDDRYLKYDYIGAVWVDRTNNYGSGIGNGGFSLRSKRLLKHLADTTPKGSNCYPEDRVISVEAYRYFNVAPKNLAQKFSTESHYQGSFGFHNIYLTDFKSYNHLMRTRVATINESCQGMTAVHSGDMGDIIYSIPIVKSMGITQLIINTRGDYGTLTTYHKACAIKPLLESCGIGVAISCGYNPAKVDVILDCFRKYHNLSTIYMPDVYGIYFNRYIDHTAAWLEVSPRLDGQYYTDSEYIVINKSSRYHNPYLDWTKLLKDCNYKLIFLGLSDEYDKMSARYPEVEMSYVHTKDLNEAKNIIAMSKLFIGNQSALFSIAEGLKHPRILEVCPYVPNCNSLYSRNYLIKTANDVEYGNKIVKGEVML